MTEGVSSVSGCGQMPLTHIHGLGSVFKRELCTGPQPTPSVVKANVMASYISKAGSSAHDAHVHATADKHASSFLFFRRAGRGGRSSREAACPSLPRT